MEATTQHDLEQRQTMLDAWVVKRREIARLESEALELLAERTRLGDADARENPHHRDTIHRSMIAEYSAAGHVANGSVDRAFADAALLHAHHPAVREAFGQGSFTAAHVREIISAGSLVREAVRDGRVDAGTLTIYDEAAVVVAGQDTPMRTRSLVRQIAAALAGATLVERHRRAAAERAVTMRSVDDGLALITIVLPEHLAAAVMDRLTRLARQVVAARDDVEPPVDLDLLDSGEDPVFPEDLDPSDPLLDESVLFGDDTFTTDPFPEPCAEVIPADTRTIDQLRADLLADLLLTSDPTTASSTAIERVQARIQVTVAATTLAGMDDRPAELDGFGPIDPDIARELAAGSGGWSRLFVDPTGMVTETDTYTPTEAMRRFLRARDQHCRFPGCRMPVHRCQIDHNHDHALGGRTHLDNLSHFCTGHHVLKHPGIDDRHRWSARQRAGGDIEWISPLGRSYTDPAPRRVMFI